MIRLYELARPYRRWLGRCLAVVCGAGLGLLAAQADAQAIAQPNFSLTGWSPVIENTPGGGWRVVPNQHVRTENLRAAQRILERLPSGGFSASDAIEIGGKAGKLPVKVRQAVTIADAGAAIARCVRNPVCVGAAAAAGAYLYYQYRTRPSPDGELERDPGQDLQDYPAYRCNDPGNTNAVWMGPTAAAACLVMAASDGYTHTRVGSPYTVKRKTTVNNCYVNAYGRTICSLTQVTQYTFTTSGADAGGPSTTEFTVTADPTTQRQCPPVVDFSDPRYSVPGGPSGPDSKCPTGRYTERVTPAQIGERMAASPPPSTDTSVIEALRQAIAAGEEAPATVSTSGPATQVGTPTTTSTTTSSGTTTTTSTPTYTYSYNGDTITYITTVNNTTINNDGSTTNTTTTTQGPKEDPKDPCEANPNRVGCLELGAAPEDKVQKTTKDLAFSADPVGLPVGCPSDEVVHTTHGDLVISYASACDTAVRIAPLVQAIGAFVAALMVAAALRSS